MFHHRKIQHHELRAKTQKTCKSYTFFSADLIILPQNTLPLLSCSNITMLLNRQLTSQYLLWIFWVNLFWHEISTFLILYCGISAELIIKRFITFSHPCNDKVLFLGQLFEMEILIHLYVMRSPESENHICVYVCLCVFYQHTQKQITAETSNLVF